MPLHPEAVPEFCFIGPCSPIPAKAVPVGDGWVHDVKFDGYRVQVHSHVQPQGVSYCERGPGGAQSA